MRIEKGRQQTVPHGCKEPSNTWEQTPAAKNCSGPRLVAKTGRCDKIGWKTRFHFQQKIAGSLPHRAFLTAAASGNFATGVNFAG
jgi:hypothetical protein